MLIFDTQNVYMSKFAREVEAVQFLPKKGEPEFKEVIIDGASVIVVEGQYIEYDENGNAIEVWSEQKFKAKHTEVLEAAPKGKK